jgi:outer membrane protein assembly factor BamB
LWRAGGLAGDVAPSPVACSGMVYAVNAHAALCAIRLGGRGDVTATHTAWKAEDNLPDICSPLCAGGLVFLLTTQGLLTCFDAARGEKMWEQDLGTIFKASPVMVDRLIYLIATDGVTLMIDPWNGYREAARAAIPDTVYATPAFADGRIVIRGEKHLWCIGAPR